MTHGSRPYPTNSQDAHGLRRAGHIDKRLDAAAAEQAKQLAEDDDTSGCCKCVLGDSPYINRECEGTERFKQSCAKLLA